MKGHLPLAVILVSAVLFTAGGAAAIRWAAAESVVASFTTDLENRNDAQRTNILLAAARIDGTVLPRGAQFSFNQTVGARLVEDGYEKAATYQGDGVSDTSGGGICQLSSTVYNAALLAGLNIMERAPHVERVLSVGPGRDATVVYGRCDLRFVNPHPFPVRLQTREVGERLVVEVLAAQPLPRPVEVRIERLPSVDGIHVRTWRRIGTVETLVSEDAYRR